MTNETGTRAITTKETNTRENLKHLECYDCPSNKTCEFAWDEYNTKGGWCLAEK